MTDAESTTQRIVKKIEDHAKNCDGPSAVYHKVREDLDILEDRLNFKIEKEVDNQKKETEKKFGWFFKGLMFTIGIFAPTVAYIWVSVSDNKENILKNNAEIKRIDATYVTTDKLYDAVRQGVKDGIQPLREDIIELKRESQ